MSDKSREDPENKGPQNSDENPPRNATSRLPVYFVVGVVLAAAVVAAVLYFGRDRLSTEQRLRLIKLKNIANGHLENERPADLRIGRPSDFDEADKRYQQIAQQLPNDPLAVRNLAISAYLAFENLQSTVANDPTKVTPEELEHAQQKAAQAIERLWKEQPESRPIAHWLQGKLLVSSKNSVAAFDEFHQAAQLAEDDPRLWYAVYQAAEASPDPSQRAEVGPALEQVYQHAPRNLEAVLKWMMHQANSHDPRITETLAAAKKELAALRSFVLQKLGADLFVLLDEARQAAESSDWSQASNRCLRTLHLVRGEEARKVDLNRLESHPLEFMLHDFSPAFYHGWRAEPPPASTIPVKFSRLPGDQQAPSLADVKDVRLLDFDLDGRCDLVVLRRGFLEVFAAKAEGWKLVAQVEVPADVNRMLAADLFPGTAASSSASDEKKDSATAASPVNSPGTGLRFSECYDTQPGFVLYGAGGVMLFKPTSKERQADPASIAVEKQLAPALDVAGQAGGLTELKQVRAGLLIDFDHDGDLDLMFSSASGVTMWRNLGNMTFASADEGSTLPPGDHSITDMAAVDWDRDVDLDVLLCGPGGEAGLLENLRHGSFRWRPLGKGFQSLSNSRCMEVLEADGNYSWDVVGAGDSGASLVKTTMPRPGDVQPLASRSIQSGGADGVHLLDYNNDSYQDLLSWKGNQWRLHRGGPDGVFRPAENVLGDAPGEIIGCDSADLDQDGDLDLAVAAGGGVVLYANQGGNENGWIAIRPRGQDDNKIGRVNNYGIGSLMEIKSGGQYRAQVVRGQNVHFGLGANCHADTVRILWTNGVPQSIIEPPRNLRICEQMILKGSCPYLYTWNGERFEFVTDLLWAAPLGLQQSNGKLAPSRCWEYLKIPGDKLQANQQGQYVLQFTEELWEAAYFERIELIAVDHPADVEIYSNEKVGPASIAQFKIHTVKNRRQPVAAKDKWGRDVLPQIAAGDGVFMKGFERTYRQGLTDEHFLELDLGELQDPQTITLFLTGWIFPTDTSINVQLWQNPDLDGPRPPALYVPDQDGKWKQVRPFIGFPGGKTKTIAVDLSDVFLCEDYRVRIVTSQQIYWDEAFFTLNEKPEPMKLTRLQPHSADLHYRGFSQPLPPRENHPEVYDYDKVSTEPKWPPMRGYFTRYGDVTELVRSEDDRMVVMGAGDEMTIRFRAPTGGPSPGWKRDFILHNVGWDKDADLNTLYGQTVEPMPFVKMESYPQQSPTDADDDQHRAYLQKYQTRRQRASAFWRLGAADSASFGP